MAATVDHTTTDPTRSPTAKLSDVATRRSPQPTISWPRTEDRACRPIRRTVCRSNRQTRNRGCRSRRRRATGRGARKLKGASGVKVADWAALGLSWAGHVGHAWSWRKWGQSV